jgi:hypothetical protein
LRVVFESVFRDIIKIIGHLQDDDFGNTRERPGFPGGAMIDGYREETDNLYVLMREEGCTAGDKATFKGLTAEAEGDSLSADAKWQRLRFWFTAIEPGAVKVDLGDGKVLELGAVTPDKVKGAAPSPVKITVTPGTKLCKLRWLEQETKK